MTRTADVVIVGAGVIGCALARELAGRGLAVTVVEKGQPGEEASWAAAGLLSPQADGELPGPFFDLRLESRALYPDWTRELLEETGLDVGYRKTGLLRCAFGEEATDRVFDHYRWQGEAGLPVEPRDAAALDRQLEGRLSPQIRRALFFPEEAVVEPRKLVRALREAAERRGVRILAETAARRFRIEAGACRGVETDDALLEADRVVDAAGAWAGFDPELAVAIPVRPVRGQIVELVARRGTLPTVVQSDEVYLLPRPDGRVVVGATFEEVGYEKDVTAEAVGWLITAAIRLVPSLSAARFSTAWSGLRPATPDGLPLLGDSGIPGLFLATGHFRNGILLAPVTARLLADRLVGESGRDLSPFGLGRFAVPRRQA